MAEDNVHDLAGRLAAVMALDGVDVHAIDVLDWLASEGLTLTEGTDEATTAYVLDLGPTL